MDRKKILNDNIEDLLKDQKITFSKSKNEIWEEFFKNKISADSHQRAIKEKSLINIVKLKSFKYAIAASILFLLGVAVFSRYFSYSIEAEIPNSQYANTIENSVLLESFLIDDEEVNEHFDRYVINQLVEE